MNFPPEPFRIKTVERIRRTSREEREQFLKQAGFNVFNIPSDAIFIDLLTDSGTAAMSDRQWGALMQGDEAYAGSRSFQRFEAAVRDITGFAHVIPTHQGRVAENLLFSTLGKPGVIIPNNTHFDTTHANVSASGALALDLPVEEALHPALEHPFKGNMNVPALDDLLSKKRTSVPLVAMTVTNNSAGGQPVSMENIRETSRVCKKYGVPFFFDCARYAENCWFIHQREAGYENKPIIEIARELFSYGDGCWMSSKKDALVNIGGFLAMNDETLAQTLKNKLILIEGFPTYGGLAGRDLEAIAAGLYEGLEPDYLDYRTGQVRALGDMLIAENVPVVRPIGGHAVFIDAKAFAPHIPQSQFPGVALTVALYREAGIRAVEIGSLMFTEKDAKTGEAKYPELDLVRLAIPRRVYTSSHMICVAEATVEIFRSRKTMRGLRLTYEAPMLRHFTARMEEI
ncbi:MAG: tryptophanase [bacterium]|nr:tryptophanase [bacterium]